MAIEKLPPNQDGAPRCRISWYVGAKKIVRVLTVDFETAKRILRQKLAERDLVKWGQTIPKLYPEVAAGFLAVKVAGNCRDGYIEELERVLVKVLGARWKSEILSEISPPMIRDYLRQRSNEGASPQTVKKERAMLATLFSWAICQDYALRSPVDAVEVPKVDAQPPHFLTAAEVRNLLLSSPDALQRAISVLVAVGCRADELCSLSSDSVRSGVLLISGRKCRDFVHLPVNEALTKLTLTVAGQGWTPDSLRRGIKSAAKRAQLPAELTTHHLRHTCATWMISAGIPLWDVKRQLGHSSAQTTERYAHVANIDWRRDQAYLPEMLRECLPWLPCNKTAPDQTASGAVTLPA
jgi:site-specific recombinase XerD